MNDKSTNVNAAQRHFTRAAAALTEWPIDRSALTFALFEGSLGMLAIAKADEDNAAQDAVAKILSDERTRRAEGL